VHLAATAAGLEVIEPAYQPLAAPHVGEFDRSRTIEDHGVIDGVVDAIAPGYLAVLAPYQVGSAAGAPDGPLTVTALDAGDNAAAWLVEGADGAEVAWLRKPSGPTTLTLPSGDVLTTDAELTILDLGGAFGLIARGTTASIDGQSVVQGEAADGVATEEP
jgi:hypothetical protein